MKFKISRESSLDSWNHVLWVARKAPVIKNVVQRIHMHAFSDLDEVQLCYEGIVTMDAYIEAEVSSDGTASVDRRMFSEMANADSSVDISRKDGTLSISEGGSKNTLPVGFDSEPFSSDLPEMMSIDRDVFLSGILSVSFAVRDSHRAISSLISIQSSEDGKTLEFFCLDGHRFAFTSKPVVNALDSQICIHSQCFTQLVGFLKRSGDIVRICAHAGKLWISSNSVLMGIPVITGQKSDASPFLKMANDGVKHSCEVDRKDAIKKLKRCKSIFAKLSKETRDLSSMIGNVSDGSLVFTVIAKDVSAQNTVMTAEVKMAEMSGDEALLGARFSVNIKYLQQALEEIGDPSVVIEWCSIDDKSSILPIVTIRGEENKETVHLIVQRRIL